MTACYGGIVLIGHSPQNKRKPTGLGFNVTMVVVEEPLIAKLVCAVLQRRGYTARTANLPEAAALIRLPDSEEKILITNAPAAFTEFGDGLRLLYLTSSPDPRIQAAFPNCRVVHKPFDPEELVQAISELSGPPNV